MNKQINLILAFVFALAISIVVLFSFNQGVGAAPVLAPTPVGNLVQSDNQATVPFQTTTALTADTNSPGRDVQRYEWCDLQTTVDVGTVNTTTITVQFSNDNSNWDSGPAVLSNIAADETDMTRVALFGRYTRFVQDVTNSNPITITLLGLCK
jgi:cytoskeletal protein RodZ